jgi:anti-sigma-K factor RskA
MTILCILLFKQDSHLRKTVGDQTQQINNLNQLAQSLSAATNNLQQAVLALQETNRLANLRIAMLNSLEADAPKAIAVSLWDNEKQDGVLVVQNLKALAADRDYELWVMDENQNPVAAGVFHLDADGTARLDFKPSRSIKTAGKFCVTEEVKGGVASPTIKNLVLASN